MRNGPPPARATPPGPAPGRRAAPARSSPRRPTRPGRPRRATRRPPPGGRPARRRPRAASGVRVVLRPAAEAVQPEPDPAVVDVEPDLPGPIVADPARHAGHRPRPRQAHPADPPPGIARLPVQRVQVLF